MENILITDKKGESLLLQTVQTAINIFDLQHKVTLDLGFLDIKENYYILFEELKEKLLEPETSRKDIMFILEQIEKTIKY